jgi:hypothetical protein
MFSLSDYGDKTDEPVISKNATFGSETDSLMPYYLVDMHNRSSNNHTQYSAQNRTGRSSLGEQAAEENRKKTRLKRDTESSSQVNEMELIFHVSSIPVPYTDNSRISRGGL